MVGESRKRPLPDTSKTDSVTSDEDRSRSIASALVRWYAKHRRTLPWRERADPYAVWVSEIMLQQTQVTTVIPYFERWMRAFPDLVALAEASLDDVLAAWAGLGYYSRARNLHRAARLVVSDHAGKLPSDPEGLLKLPGIGRYTAGAIASIAFERPTPAIDGNVERVVTRVQALRGDPKLSPTARRIVSTVTDWLRFAGPRRFNQALMELGALICTPENPRCSTCPLLSLCLGCRADLVSVLPESRTRPKISARGVVVLVSQHRGSYYVVRQPETARHWAGLYTLPYLEYASPLSAPAAALELLRALDPKAELLGSKAIAHLSYPITRFRFEARVFQATRLRVGHSETHDGAYVRATQLAALAMPAPHRRILSALAARNGQAP